ncbi:MAG: DNA-binding protein [Lachnospiraceae bacterium]|nr:DNA-binding protein [Lachnospiraceae bacterium]
MKQVDKIFEYTILYDFYGALLKDKNRSVFEDYMFNDMSLSEIAEDLGITRQGVRDIVERSKQSLVDYEDKLGLIKRFEIVKENASEINSTLDDIREYVSVYDSKEKIENMLKDIGDRTHAIIEDF